MTDMLSPTALDIEGPLARWDAVSADVHSERRQIAAAGNALANLILDLRAELRAVHQ